MKKVTWTELKLLTNTKYFWHILRTIYIQSVCEYKIDIPETCIQMLYIYILVVLVYSSFYEFPATVENIII